MFLNTIEPYKPPKDSQVHLLGSNLLPLSFEEMMELSNLYQDENWSKIAYSVTNSLLQPYVDDILSEIIKRKVDRDIHNSNKINSLYFKTQVCNPFCCDWTREIKYFTGNGEYFLGGIKVFAIQLKSVVDLTSILRLISGLAQVNILSNLPCNRMLIALVHPEYWELVFAEVAVNSKLPNRYNKSRKVNISMFSEPRLFFKAILSGKTNADVNHEEYTVRIRV